MKLHLSPDLALPLDAVTQTFALLANRGAGKTYTASVFAEELLEAQQQVVVVDPMGVWWGLRSSADGKSAGYPITILGGEHADVPLEETGGKLAAKFIVDTSQSVILDLSHLRKNAQKRFMVDFAEELYHLNRTALHILLDEADAFAPQRVPKGEHGVGERLLGAISDWVRRGRARGIGVSLITQRSAVINKDILELAETLIALRTGGPRNIDAVLAWVEHHGVDEQAKAMLESLPKMQNGDAWVWSPAWLDLFTRTHIRERRTFDSSRTPRPGERPVKPKVIAPVDLARLTAEMKASVERAKAEDPKELRKRLAALEAGAKKKADPVAAARDAAALEKAVKRAIDARDRDYAARNAKLASAVRNVSQMVGRVEEAARMARHVFAGLQEVAGSELPAPAIATSSSNGHARPQPVPLPGAARAVARPTAPAESLTISRTQQRMLDAIAFFESVGQSAPSRAAVAGFCAVSHTTGSFSNNLSALRTTGLIEDRADGAVALTEVGRDAANVDSPPSLAELHEVWTRRLSGTQGAMLSVLIGAHPDAITRDALAEALNIKSDTGSFSNNLSKLRTLGLLEDRSRSQVAASTLLFPDGITR